MDGSLLHHFLCKFFGFSESHTLAPRTACLRNHHVLLLRARAVDVPEQILTVISWSNVGISRKLSHYLIGWRKKTLYLWLRAHEWTWEMFQKFMSKHAGCSTDKRDVCFRNILHLIKDLVVNYINISASRFIFASHILCVWELLLWNLFIWIIVLTQEQ